MVTVQVEGSDHPDRPLMVEPTAEFSCGKSDVCFENSLVKLTDRGYAKVPLANFTGLTRKLERGVHIGCAAEATVVSEPEALVRSSEVDSSCTEGPHDSVCTIASRTMERKKKLAGLIAEVGPTLQWQDRDALRQLLFEKNAAFAVEDGECGSTDLVQMSINTGYVTPKKQPLRRTPFAVRREVAEQLRKMQSQGVIQPSTSPWASPVVLVRKKDGSLRFCIDYHGLNSVTKTDQFPLPQIDDLLDQLGKTKYFTALDLASGY